MDRRGAIVFTICAAPRLLALAVFPHGPSTYYNELATSLLTTGAFAFDGVPSTYFEPLYPVFLAAARMVTGDAPRLVLLLQIAVASIGGVLLDRLGSRLANREVGMYAAVSYAVYPYLIRQSVALLDVTLCTTLAIAATLALSGLERPRAAVGCGALFGLLALTRSSFLPAIPGAAIWLASRGRPSTRLGAGGRLSALMALTALLVLAPWLVRNARVDGSPLPSRMGQNLYMSTSIYADALPVHDIDLLVPLGLADIEDLVAGMRLPPQLEDRAIDDAMLGRAIAFMRERPAHVLWLKARNALYLASPVLLPREAKSPGTFAAMQGGVVRIVNARRRPWIEDASHALAQSALLLLAAIGVMHRGLSGRDAPLLIMLASNAAVWIAFFPTTRFMAPVMFVLMFYAAVGFDWCGSRWRSTRPQVPEAHH